jgi:hypothetical protein
MTEFIEGTPPFQQFKNDVIPIFSDGNLQQAYDQLITLLECGKRDSNGNVVTWGHILKKYTDHINWWNYSFKKTEAAGYLKESNRAKRLEIEEFISREMYNREWRVSKGNLERDTYLFGSLPIDNLKAQLQNFRDGQKK